MKIQELGPGNMILGPLVMVAETAEGEEFEANISLDVKAVVFQFPEGKYAVTFLSIADEVVKFRKEKR